MTKELIKDNGPNACKSTKPFKLSEKEIEELREYNRKGSERAKELIKADKNKVTK